MSARTITRRTTALAAAAGAATVLLALGGAALAGPPAEDLAPCTNSPDDVRQWPGTFGAGATACSDGHESCLLLQPAREPQILEFDWRSAGDACCYPAREPQILEFDWRHAPEACTPLP